MPMVNIEYDNTKVRKNEISALCDGIQHIVSVSTQIEDVFVYANSAEIKVKVAPIEVFITMTSQKIKDEDKLFEELKTRLLKWKKENGFQHPINLTLVPMKWKVEIGI